MTVSVSGVQSWIWSKKWFIG